MTRNMCLKNVLMILFREESRPWRPMQKDGLGWREREKQRSDSWKKEPEESLGYGFYIEIISIKTTVFTLLYISQHHLTMSYS